MAERWVAVARRDDVPPGQGRLVEVEGRRLAVFLDEGAYRVLDDACPHMGASLAVGTVHEGAVVCDRHLWAYRLRDGQCLDVPRLIARTYPARVVGDWIEADLAQRDDAEAVPPGGSGAPADSHHEALNDAHHGAQADSRGGAQGGS